MTDLQEIIEYWSNKYPSIVVHLWPHQDGEKYRGKMISPNEHSDLCADTVGELIAQGEAFLRRMNNGERT